MNTIYQNGKQLPLMESFYTLQGEGYHTGKASFFIRLGGCDIGCKWCDSKASWNAELFALTSVDAIVQDASQHQAKVVVVTGGEPLLYPLDYFCDELHKRDIQTYLETSGVHPLSGSWDWICLSPKQNHPPISTIYEKADELKMIITSEEDFAMAESYCKKVNTTCKLYLQPEWSVRKEIIPLTINYVKHNPKWTLSLQTHKYIGIP